MPEILSDNDLPTIANSAAKRAKWAKTLLAAAFGSAVKRLENPPMQGAFSRTLFATLADKTELVLQLRNEVLDLDAFAVARATLGEDVVPWVRALPDETLEAAGIWAYALERKPGTTWLRGVAGKGAAGRVAINRSLGAILARGKVPSEDEQGSRGALSQHVRPQLEGILKSSLPEVAPYRALCQAYLDHKLESLAALPLWIAHADLNEVNILVDPDNNCKVTGLVDWERSAPLPLGVNLGRLHSLAGEYTGGEFWMPPEFEEAEKALLENLFGGIPDENTKKQVAGQMELVQDAIHLATLLDTFMMEEGQLIFSPVVLKSLPKLLTYRLPVLRGSDPPYSV